MDESFKLIVVLNIIIVACLIVIQSLQRLEKRLHWRLSGNEAKHPEMSMKWTDLLESADWRRPLLDLSSQKMTDLRSSGPN